MAANSPVVKFKASGGTFGTIGEANYIF